jgi:hypothetical protein
LEIINSDLQGSNIPHIISVSPNPTSQDFLVDFRLSNGAQSSQIQIMDLQGDVVFVIEITEQTESIVVSTQSMKSGLYFISLKSNNVVWDVKRVIVSK